MSCVRLFAETSVCWELAFWAGRNTSNPVGPVSSFLCCKHTHYGHFQATQDLTKWEEACAGLSWPHAALAEPQACAVAAASPIPRSYVVPSPPFYR